MSLQWQTLNQPPPLPLFLEKFKIMRGGDIGRLAKYGKLSKDLIVLYSKLIWENMQIIGNYRVTSLFKKMKHPIIIGFKIICSSFIISYFFSPCCHRHGIWSTNIYTNTFMYVLRISFGIFFFGGFSYFVLGPLKPLCF